MEINISAKFLLRVCTLIVAAKKPFFVWFNSTRMHYHTHIPDKWKGRSGLSDYADGMLQHDE